MSKSTTVQVREWIIRQSYFSHILILYIKWICSSLEHTDNTGASLSSIQLIEVKVCTVSICWEVHCSLESVWGMSGKCCGLQAWISLQLKDCNKVKYNFLQRVKGLELACYAPPSKMLRNKGKCPSSIPFPFRICEWGWDWGWVVAPLFVASKSIKQGRRHRCSSEVVLCQLPY